MPHDYRASSCARLSFFSSGGDKWANLLASRGSTKERSSVWILLLVLMLELLAIRANACGTARMICGGVGSFAQWGPDLAIVLTAFHGAENRGRPIDHGNAGCQRLSLARTNPRRCLSRDLRYARASEQQ